MLIQQYSNFIIENLGLRTGIAFIISSSSFSLNYSIFILFANGIPVVMDSFYGAG